MFFDILFIYSMCYCYVCGYAGWYDSRNTNDDYKDTENKNIPCIYQAITPAWCMSIFLASLCFEFYYVPWLIHISLLANRNLHRLAEKITSPLILYVVIILGTDLHQPLSILSLV